MVGTRNTGSHRLVAFMSILLFLYNQYDLAIKNLIKKCLFLCVTLVLHFNLPDGAFPMQVPLN